MILAVPGHLQYSLKHYECAFGQFRAEQVKTLVKPPNHKKLLVVGKVTHFTSGPYSDLEQKNKMQILM